VVMVSPGTKMRVGLEEEEESLGRLVGRLFEGGSGMEVSLEESISFGDVGDEGVCGW
jgi:hypothetical protein